MMNAPITIKRIAKMASSVPGGSRREWEIEISWFTHNLEETG